MYYEFSILVFIGYCFELWFAHYTCFRPPATSLHTTGMKLLSTYNFILVSSFQVVNFRCQQIEVYDSRIVAKKLNAMICATYHTSRLRFAVKFLY